jgi:hypothetical protein
VWALGLAEELQRKMQEVDCGAARMCEYVQLLINLSIPKGELQVRP